MAKSFSEHIALRVSARQPSRTGKNRASFLAVRNDVRKALDDGWPVKAIWDTLRDEGKIEFGYDAFIGYVNRLIRNPEPSPAKPPADQVKADKPAPKGKAKTDAPQKRSNPMHTTNLRKVGGSVMLAVPPAILDLLHLQAGATVGVAVADGRLVVDPKPLPRYTLDELLAEAEASGAYPLSAEEREWIDAPAVGKELI